MGKKEITIFVFLFLTIFLIVSINASASDEGYDCLENKIEGTGCDSLSLEEQIFSALATGKCIEELENKSINNGTCWSTGSNCDIKLTSQAIMALEENEKEIEKPLEWLLKQNT